MQDTHFTSGTATAGERVASTYISLVRSCPGMAKYATLYRAVLETIRLLGPGYCLPPARQLAVSIGVSRWAVATAYGRLAAEGYLKLVTRWGAFINNTEHWPLPTMPSGKSFSRGAGRPAENT